MKVYKTKKEVIEDLIEPSDVVLDVGFWGQAVKVQDPLWPHKLLKERARAVYGVDIDYDESELDEPRKYRKQNAEEFDMDEEFDVVFASELIEHLSNPGRFLDACKRNLKKDGRLIITTPNSFNIFTLFEKLIKREPTVNPDHTFYFNPVVLKKLLEKNGWKTESVSYLDTFKGTDSIKRMVIYGLHRFLALFTDKYMGTMVFVARKNTKDQL